MNDRQVQLLQKIVEFYVKNAQPVGSKVLVEKGDFEVSSATIRNEMAQLERDGLIYQPHTSAGRVPTEAGYQYYVEHCITKTDLPKYQQDQLRVAAEKNSPSEPQFYKTLAKAVAEESQLAVFVGFGPNDFYYTGISNLFDQPEFYHNQVIHQFTRIIDHLDQVIAGMYEQVPDETTILIGKHNPFGQNCSTLINRYEKGEMRGLLGVIGPMRMDYQKNLNLLSFSQELITSTS